MSFAALPPEINSGRMYAGAGAGPMLAAAAAWDAVAAELTSATASYRGEVSGLTGGAWLGPASVSMAAAAAMYTGWMSATAEQAKQAADQARAAVAAYEAAFAATVPPEVVAENRALLLSLVATNLFGQNSPAIAATETQYAEMWAQDVTAMYGYASGSAAASRLTPFTAPPQDTNPGGMGVEAGAVGQAVATSAAAGPDALSQLLGAVPASLQGLASGDRLATMADWLNFTSGWTFIASGVLFVLGPMLVGPVAGALPTSSVSWSGPEAGASGTANLVDVSAPGARGWGDAGVSVSPERPDVWAGRGRAGSIGAMSVPQTWTAAIQPATRAATALPGPALVGWSEAGVNAPGAGYGGVLPATLTAAAAGGGGAAGSGWAATRAGAGGQRGGVAPQSGGVTPARYGRVPAVLPHVTRDAVPGPPRWPAHDTQLGEGPLSASLGEQINDLRRQIAELATERDVLMRSLALWAKGPTAQ